MDTSYEIINNYNKSASKLSPSNGFQSTPNKSVNQNPSLIVTSASATKTPGMNASGVFLPSTSDKDSNNNKMNASLNSSNAKNGAKSGQGNQQDLAKIAKKLEYDYSLAGQQSNAAAASTSSGKMASSQSFTSTLPKGLNEVGMKLFGLTESSNHGEKKLAIYEEKVSAKILCRSYFPSLELSSARLRFTMIEE